jgi:cholesterol transport system auxiliary component
MSMADVTDCPGTVARVARLARAGSAAAVIACALQACTLLPPPAEEPALHLIDATPPATIAAERRPLTLDVAPVRAAPGFDTPAMIYVQKPYALDRFALHRWADAPARMLTPLLVRTLESGGAFAAVTQGAPTVAADVRLDTELVRLQQNFMERPSRVELALRVQLIDVRSRRVVAARSIEVVATAPSDDPAGGVAAANTATMRALAQVATFCSEAAVTLPPR